MMGYFPKIKKGSLTSDYFVQEINGIILVISGVLALELGMA